MYDCGVHRTAFVTGGTGFLGRHIVEQLTSLGWHVVAMHRPDSDVRHLVECGAELCVGSITDAKSVRRAMPASCDAVFHVAGDMSLWSGGNAEQTRINVMGTRIVAEAAVEKEAKRFVHTSSVSAWGEQRVVPFDEPAKSTARRSRVNYERTKYLGELGIDKMITHGLRAVILNPGAIVGRYDRTGWARMIRLVHAEKLPGDPTRRDDLAHANQVARAHIAAVDHARPGERYLLGGADASFVEAVGIMGELAGKEGAGAADAPVDAPNRGPPLAVGLARHPATAQTDPRDRGAHEAPAALLPERQGDRRAGIPPRSPRRHAARVVRVAGERESARPVAGPRSRERGEFSC